MLEKLYKKFGKRKVWLTALVVGLLIIGAVLASLFMGNKKDVEEIQEGKRSVETISVSDYHGGALGIIAPTADGRSFVVRAETGGRVNKVAKMGNVAQGAIIAEIDNAAQRAALLQAEGVYEAALAAANRSDINADDAKFALVKAKEEAIGANRVALTSWNSVLYNTVDELISNPRGSSPGVRIRTLGDAIDIREDRVTLEATLNDWQKEISTLNANQSTTALVSAIDTAISRTASLASMVDIFIELLPGQPVDEVFTASEISSLQSDFATARASLNTQKASLETAKSNLLRAEESLKSAEVGATGGAVSAADAQIKQALGTYQAAQAAYNKSLVRAPFAGRVTSLNVSVGDIINPGSDIAIILPNDGVETESSFSLPLSAIKYTPAGAYVFTVTEDNTIHGVAVKTNLVTTNSINVTGLSGNEIIVKDIRGLKEGDEVELASE